LRTRRHAAVVQRLGGDDLTEVEFADVVAEAAVA
jgi:hypothetical protein